MTKSLLLFFIIPLIVSCGEKKPEKSLQEQYQDVYSRAVCISMSVHVDAYVKDPLNYSWRMQGISDPIQFAFNQPEWKLKAMGWRAPSEFIPSSEKITFATVSKWCPGTAIKFKNIPY
jgi:hypothetical protein